MSKKSQKTYSFDNFLHFPKFIPLPHINFWMNPNLIKFPYVYFIKVTLCKVDVSRSFCSKVIEEKPLARPSPLGKGRVNKLYTNFVKTCHLKKRKMIQNLHFWSKKLSTYVQKSDEYCCRLSYKRFLGFRLSGGVSLDCFLWGSCLFWKGFLRLFFWVLVEACRSLCRA